jgi:hypothetical protein
MNSKQGQKKARKVRVTKVPGGLKRTWQKASTVYEEHSPELFAPPYTQVPPNPPAVPQDVEELAEAFEETHQVVAVTRQRSTSTLARTSVSYQG